MSTDKFAVELLDVDNYATWSIKMRALLLFKELWGAVVGHADTTQQDNYRALALILLHVKDHHLSTISTLDTAKAAWDTLAALFASKCTARILQLRRS